MTVRVTGLWTYPVKGLQGVACEAVEVAARGFAGDRRWMVVDAANRFLTRREVPAMALVQATPGDREIILRHATLGTCVVGQPGGDAPVVAAKVWRDTVSLRLADAAAEAFLSEALGRPVRLAWQNDASVRPIAAGRGEPGDHVSLADGFPLLLTSEASLLALNDALARPVPMARFRANLVIGGGESWAEDRWRTIRVGGVTIALGHPCARCVVVTQDVETGERRDGNEPLATLRVLGRTVGGGVMFGQNGLPRTLGRIAIGDSVEVLEDGPSTVGSGA